MRVHDPPWITLAELSDIRDAWRQRTLPQLLHVLDVTRPRESDLVTTASDDSKSGADGGVLTDGDRWKRWSADARRAWWVETINKTDGLLYGLDSWLSCEIVLWEFRDRLLFPISSPASAWAPHALSDSGWTLTWSGIQLDIWLDSLIRHWADRLLRPALIARAAFPRGRAPNEQDLELPPLDPPEEVIDRCMLEQYQAFLSSRQTYPVWSAATAYGELARRTNEAKSGSIVDDKLRHRYAWMVSMRSPSDCQSLFGIPHMRCRWIAID